MSKPNKILFWSILFSNLILIHSAQARVFVNGYYRSNGTYVQPHYRSDPDGYIYNNWSYPGNINPYTDKITTGNPPVYFTNYSNNNIIDDFPKTIYTCLANYYLVNERFCCHLNSTLVNNKCQCNSGYIYDGVINQCIIASEVQKSYPKNNTLKNDAVNLPKITDSTQLKKLLEKDIIRKPYGIYLNSNVKLLTDPKQLKTLKENQIIRIGGNIYTKY